MRAVVRDFFRSLARRYRPVKLLLAWRLDRIRALRLSRRTPVSDKPFRVFNIELTNRCPMRCVMCARTNNMTRAIGDMPFSTFKAVIDQYAENNPAGAAGEYLWLHHFGESLLHPEFAAFIRYAVSKGVRTAMSINPIMLTPPVTEELLASGIHKLQISLDGHDDESFMKIRGVAGAYERSKKNLEAFLKRKAELGAGTLAVLSMIDFGLNRESIAAQKSLWEAASGIDEFRSKPFTTWDGAASDINALAAAPVDNEMRRRLFSAVSCEVPWQTVTVTWDGDVVPCCFDYNKKYILGNVRENSLREIWNGDNMRRLRLEFLSNSVRNPLCLDCPMLYPKEEEPEIKSFAAPGDFS